MRLRIITVGQRMPDWIAQGFREYAGRFPPALGLELRELPPGDRGRGGDPSRACAVEGKRLLEAVPKGARMVALDVEGRQETTPQVSRRLAGWMQDGQDVAFLVGGADGLAADVLDASHDRWSLSPLTLPHMLVRVVLAEQLYRAWTILENHPYHR